MANTQTAELGYKCTLSVELLKKAEDELNEKEKWRDRDIQALRDMVLTHKGLKSRMDDAFLLRFLRARKFDYDRAYNLLLNYYTIRASNMDVFHGLSPRSVEHVYNSGVVTVLPERDADGRRILYIRPGRWDPNEFALMDVIRTALINMEIIIMDEQTQVCGIVVVENMSDIGLIHARNMDQKAAKIMTSLIQDSFPMRIKAVHVVNEPAIFGAIFAVIRPFLKEKTVKRFNFHGSSLESLHKHFNVDILPQELGGKMPPTDELAQIWKAKVLSHNDMFHDFEDYKIELQHEIGKSRLADSTTECLTGTYKKLNID